MKRRYSIPLFVLIGIAILTVEWVVLLPTSPNEAHTYAEDSVYVHPHDEYYVYHDEYLTQFPYGEVCLIYRLDMHVDKEDFDSQVDKTQIRRDFLMNDTHCISLVDYNNGYVRKIAEFLDTICYNDSDMDKVYYATQFVNRNIKYNSDADIYGVEDYWATPVETLYLRTGDCEDKAVLTCSILLAMGFDGMLINYDGHCAPAVRLDGIVYLSDFNLSYPTTDLTYHGMQPERIFSASDIKEISVSSCIGKYIYGIRGLFGF